MAAMGNFMFMGLIGIVLASLVESIFLASSALQFAISLIGVVIFVGLTAWDTQKIKEMYSAADTSETGTRRRSSAPSSSISTSSTCSSCCGS